MAAESRFEQFEEVICFDEFDGKFRKREIGLIRQTKDDFIYEMYCDEHDVISYKESDGNVYKFGSDGVICKDLKAVGLSHFVARQMEILFWKHVDLSYPKTPYEQSLDLYARGLSTKLYNEE